MCRRIGRSPWTVERGAWRPSSVALLVSVGHVNLAPYLLSFPPPEGKKARGKKRVGCHPFFSGFRVAHPNGTGT